MANPIDEIAMCALSNNSVNAASYNPRLQLDAKDMTFRTDEQKVVDQQSTGTCWLQAGVTFLSAIAARRGLKIQFSVPHLVFFDKLHKSEAFLHAYAKAENERVRWHIIKEGVSDGGTWGMFMFLVRTYGLIPYDARLPTRHAQSTRQYNDYLNNYLRDVAPLVADGTLDFDRAMHPVLVSLMRAFAPPVAAVQLSAHTHGRDFQGSPLAVASLVRQEWPYVVLCHSPDRSDGVYIGPFTNDALDPEQDAFHVVQMDTLVQACLRQLECEIPIWFTCDVHYDFSSKMGVAEENLFNIEALLGLPKTHSKRDRMKNLSTAPVHAMLLTAVKVVDGVPQQWRIQNSWGSDTTHNDGFITASHAWFCSHVFQVAVDSCFVRLPPAPDDKIYLPPWDIFATVARSDPSFVESLCVPA